MYVHRTAKANAQGVEGGKSETLQCLFASRVAHMCTQKPTVHIANNRWLSLSLCNKGRAAEVKQCTSAP